MPGRLNRLQLFIFALVFAGIGGLLTYWIFAAENLPSLVVGQMDVQPLQITKDDKGKLHYSHQEVVFEVLSDNTLVCGDKSTPDILTTAQLTQAETDSIVDRVIAAGLNSERDQILDKTDYVGELTWVKVAAKGVDKTVNIFDNPQGNQFAQKVRAIAKDVCKKANKQIDRAKAPKIKQDFPEESEESTTPVSWVERRLFPLVEAAGVNIPDETTQYSRINETRTSKGLSKLPPSICLSGNYDDDKLHRIARTWSYKMASRGAIYHNRDLASQVETFCGSKWEVVGENVGVGGSSQSIYDAFLRSPAHYSNIVDSRWNYAGVGAYKSSDGKIWITQLFLKYNGTLKTYSTTTASSSTPTTSTCPTTDAPITNKGTNKLVEGQSLKSNEYLTSTDGRYRLRLQADGNLVERSDTAVIWSSGTACKGITQATLRPDGNFVLKKSDGTVVWSTNTTGSSGHTLVVQNDNNVVLYGSNGALWSSRSGRLY